MDGGRALRALLATRMEYTRATQRAAMIGQGMAILFGFIGLQGNLMLIFIALFVWIGAGQEASVVQMKSALAGIPLRRTMLTHFRTLSPTSTLGDAVDVLLTHGNGSGAMQGHEIPTDGSVAIPSLSSALRSSVGASAGTVLFVTVLDRSLVDRRAFPQRRSRECGGAGDHMRRDCRGQHHERADAQRPHHD